MRQPSSSITFWVRYTDVRSFNLHCRSHLCSNLMSYTTLCFHFLQWASRRITSLCSKKWRTVTL